MRERGKAGRSLPVVVPAERDAVPHITRNVKPGTILYADEAKDYDALHAMFQMKRINHSESYAEGEVSTNQAESFFSRLRRAGNGDAPPHRRTLLRLLRWGEFVARGQPAALKRRAVPGDHGRRAPPPGVEAVEGLLAAAQSEPRAMSVYRFHMVGPAEPVELEVEVASLDELHGLMSCQRFVTGRMTHPDADGVLNGVLLATGRVQCVVEVS